MYRISKSFHFSAAHHLPDLPDDHPCKRVHGHNYVVVVFMRSPYLDPDDFVVDYRDLDPVRRYIDDCLDHRDLNEVLAPTRTTAENLARFLFDRFIPIIPRLVAVQVQETPTTMAEYSPA